jgi:hypothetical protein
MHGRWGEKAGTRFGKRRYHKKRVVVWLGGGGGGGGKAGDASKHRDCYQRGKEGGSHRMQGRRWWLVFRHKRQSQARLNFQGGLKLGRRAGGNATQSPIQISPVLLWIDSRSCHPKQAQRVHACIRSLSIDKPGENMPNGSAPNQYNWRHRFNRKTTDAGAR